MNPAAFLPSGRPAPHAERQQSGGQWFQELRDHVASHIGDLRHPTRWTLRGRALAVLVAIYLTMMVLIIVPGTFLQHLDLWVVARHFGSHHASWLWWVKIVVGFGQRWIITYVLQIVILVACLRARSLRPMVYFVVALVLMNASVGVVKTAIGRIGPFDQPDATISAHKIFVPGGDIWPSGHVSNAVVMFGVMAMAIPRLRKPLIAFAVAASVGVGLGTIYMRTHWTSDVIGGWVAGGIVLLVIPSVMPWADRFADQVVVWVRAAVHRRPRLHRTCHAVLHWGMRVVPQDPDYWAGSAPRSAARARDEFDDWPGAGPAGRPRPRSGAAERQRVTR